MKWLNSSFLLLLLSTQSLAFEHFITRKGHQLFDGDQEFRFAGLHAPELHRIENDAKGTCPHDPRTWGQYFQWPTKDEQTNWIKALVHSGHKAMRIYVLSVAQPADEACGRETHILAPLEKGAMPRLNERAMVVYDQMIALADQYGLRLILPFIDHWQWWGGREQLAAFYAEPQEAFYDVNSQTYKAYQNIIKQVIQRKNTLTGRHYFDEKAIMAWETGNELKDSTQPFLEQTVALIHQLAPKQLIVDGNYLQLNEYAINNPYVDIISNHFYTTNNNNKPETIKQDLQKIAGRKVYMVGEFGLTDTSILNDIMQTAVHYEYKGAKAAGAFIWGFRGHRHNGGFYFHKEYTGHYSYRLPGFIDAKDNDEINVVNLVRLSQAQMAGLDQVPALPIPEAPILRAIINLTNIQWLGAPLGQHYRIERSQNPEDKWHVIGENISDGKQHFDPAVDSLFADSAPLINGRTYYYRVIAVNDSGESQPSNIQPFTVN
jgi:hypothetical protein